MKYCDPNSEVTVHPARFGYFWVAEYKRDRTYVSKNHWRGWRLTERAAAQAGLKWAERRRPGKHASEILDQHQVVVATKDLQKVERSLSQ